MKSEKLLNKKKLKSFIGKDVLYGDEICFMHEETGLFLSADSNCSLFSKSAFGCKLSDKLTRKVIFRVNPYQTYRDFDNKVFSDGKF